MLRPPAAAWHQSKRCSKAASGSFLTPTECSLWSGCMVDESYGVSRHSSTVCGRVRAGKLTWVSLSVGQHSATAPALVRAHIYLSANRFAALLQPRQLATPATPRRCGVRTRGLKRYMERDLLHVGMGRRARTCAMRACERDRKTHLRKIASFSQILPT